MEQQGRKEDRLSSFPERYSPTALQDNTETQGLNFEDHHEPWMFPDKPPEQRELLEGGVEAFGCRIGQRNL
jgi:hypothetical protein